MNKLIRLAIIIFLWPGVMTAQKKKYTFDQIVSSIKKNIQCCSTAFRGITSDKVTAVMIFKGGAMTIVYNNGRVPVSFNLFELYKDTNAPFGIYHKAGSATLEFRINEMNTQAIRFNSTAKARDTYNQIVLLIKIDQENYKPESNILSSKQ